MGKFQGTTLIVRTLREKCPYFELFCSTSSSIWTEYREILRDVIRENADQNKSKYGLVLRSGNDWRIKKALDKESSLCCTLVGPLSDLLRALDCLSHELIIAKQILINLIFRALKLMYTCFSNIKQRTKIKLIHGRKCFLECNKALYLGLFFSRFL